MKTYMVQFLIVNEDDPSRNRWHDLGYYRAETEQDAVSCAVRQYPEFATEQMRGQLKQGELVVIGKGFTAYYG